MFRPGLFGLVQLAGGLVLAIPLAIIGVEFLQQGRSILGIGFLAIAVAMLLLPEYIVRRIGTPRDWIRRRLRAARNTSASDDE